MMSALKALGRGDMSDQKPNTSEDSEPNLTEEDYLKNMKLKKEMDEAIRRDLMMGITAQLVAGGIASGVDPSRIDIGPYKRLAKRLIEENY